MLTSSHWWCHGKKIKEKCFCCKIIHGLQQALSTSKQQSAKSFPHKLFPRRIGSGTSPPHSFPAAASIGSAPLPPPPFLLLLLPMGMLLLLMILAFMPSDVREVASSYL
uniref:Uncharacterized protein n=1 Tax=Ananas comosus var. bracteatus TaxID=296719 RepID=A0A6V7Q763_ANACO|nr:unnamed protein product [Ananas comosus var. bracteatus]